MKYFLILIFSLPLVSFAQGKFDGGDGSGYSSASLTIQSDDVLGFRETKPALLYPNPASSILFIKESKLEDVEIFDSMGQSIRVVKPTNGQLDVSSLKAGVYFLGLSNHTFKFIKK